MVAGKLSYSSTNVLWAARDSRINQMFETTASERGGARGKRTSIRIVSLAANYIALRIGWLSDMIDQLRYDPS